MYKRQIIQIVAPGTPNIFELAGDRNIMSLDLEGKAKMAVGVNLGIMWDINEQWSLGMTYRSKLKMKVNSGSIDMSTIDDPTIQAVLGQLLPKFDINPSAISSAIVKTELPLPASLTWGVSFRPVPKWEFAVDLQCDFRGRGPEIAGAAGCGCRVVGPPVGSSGSSGLSGRRASGNEQDPPASGSCLYFLAL